MTPRLPDSAKIPCHRCQSGKLSPAVWESQNIVGARLKEVMSEGIGIRARSIKDGLRRLREQVLLDRHI